MLWPSSMTIAGFNLTLEDGSSRTMSAYRDQFNTVWIIRCTDEGLRYTRCPK